tara:strand:+ start:605 stop:907 length:303 start_codon:yes stop_codon:yes gene_type:complete
VSYYSTQTISLVEHVYKKIDQITLRIRSIQKIYQQINNENLKTRLIDEHSKLKNKFIEFKTIVLLIEKSTFDKFGLSKLLSEKYLRCEKEIFSKNFLFST